MQRTCRAECPSPLLSAFVECDDRLASHPRSLQSLICANGLALLALIASFTANSADNVTYKYECRGQVSFEKKDMARRVVVEQYQYSGMFFIVAAQDERLIRLLWEDDKRGSVANRFRLDSIQDGVIEGSAYRGNNLDHLWLNTKEGWARSEFSISLMDMLITYRASLSQCRSV